MDGVSSKYTIDVSVVLARNYRTSLPADRCMTRVSSTAHDTPSLRYDPSLRVVAISPYDPLRLGTM